jgi:Fe-S cluster biogenesis protein NfuA
MAPTVRDAWGEINREAGPPRARALRLALDELRPGLLADGGNVELAGIDADGTVRLAFQGACLRCPAQRETLHRVIEPWLQAKVPGVRAVTADS